jgi:hypothetical protein
MMRAHYSLYSLVLSFFEVRFETGRWKSLDRIQLDFDPETICTVHTHGPLGLYFFHYTHSEIFLIYYYLYAFSSIAVNFARFKLRSIFDNEPNII